MTTEKKPNDLATIEDLNEAGSRIRKEMDDIKTAWTKLSDGDPANNGHAVLEIAQSVSVIVSTLAVAVSAAAASTVYVLQSLGVM
jgi:hypothetical protein